VCGEQYKKHSSQKGIFSCGQAEILVNQTAWEGGFFGLPQHSSTYPMP